MHTNVTCLIKFLIRNRGIMVTLSHVSLSKFLSTVKLSIIQWSKDKQLECPLRERLLMIVCGQLSTCSGIALQPPWNNMSICAFWGWTNYQVRWSGYNSALETVLHHFVWIESSAVTWQEDLRAVLTRVSKYRAIYHVLDMMLQIGTRCATPRESSKKFCWH